MFFPCNELEEQPRGSNAHTDIPQQKGETGCNLLKQDAGTYNPLRFRSLSAFYYTSLPFGLIHP